MKYFYHYSGFAQTKAGQTTHVDGCTLTENPVNSHERFAQIRAHMANEVGVLPSELAVASLTLLHEIGDHQTLAEEIASALLTPHNEGECQRIQLMLKTEDGSERNMGGRNKANIIDTISEILTKHGLLQSRP
jgi:hypothetical protein